MEKWVVSAKKADFKEIAAQFGIDQVTARIIRNRDIIGGQAMEEYLHGTLGDLHDPHKMKDMDHAVSILQEKLQEGKKIRIIGDYDIDGVSQFLFCTRPCGNAMGLWIMPSQTGLQMGMGSMSGWCARRLKMAWTPF